MATPNTRTESDSMGTIEVASDRYWGAQTERSLHNFDIGRETFVWGRPMVKALGILKKSAALANAELGELPRDIADLIAKAGDEVIEGKLDDHFPLVVFQTGSGTQSNMNVNEVISNRAIELAGGELGTKTPVHPNDHVNRGQSSNDTFPTGFRVALDHVFGELSHAVEELSDSFYDKGEEFEHILKLGRTQMQDAVPMTLGQEFTAFAVNLEEELRHLDYARSLLLEINLGATAIGTGLNAPPGYRELAVKHLCEITGRPFVTAADLIEAFSRPCSFRRRQVCPGCA